MRHGAFIAAVCWSLLVSTGVSCIADDRVPGTPAFYYVAADGDDSWSGELKQPNDDRTDGPFATLKQARDRIRALKAEQGGSLRQPVTVFVREGFYFLTEPLKLAPQDSGTHQYRVTYAAYPDENPVISGGRLISDWEQQGRNGSLVAELPEVRDQDWRFSQLWTKDGVRLTRARHPNSGLLQIDNVPDLNPKDPYNVGQKRFQYKPGDLLDYQDLADAQIVLLHFWVSARLPVQRIDEENHMIELELKTRRKMTESGKAGKLAPYYIENALELMDSPGEWFLDCSSGKLHFIPKTSMGNEGSSPEVVAPVLSKLVHIEGRPESGDYVEYVHFDGLTFSHTDWLLPKGEAGDHQAASIVPAALYAEGAKRCRFSECTIAHIGNYGIELGRGCQENEIVGCSVHDLGAGGIRVGEKTQRGSENEQCFANEVVDCEIFDGGHFFYQGIGLWLGQTYENRIAHNHIHDFYYTGISVGWTWGYGSTLASDNRIEYNHVHHIGGRSEEYCDERIGPGPILSDMGGIYTLGTQPGTTISHNVFHDIAARAYGGWGIYFDEGSSFIRAEDNLVYRTTHGGFHQHYGKENIIQNNIFAYGRDQQIQRTRIEDHLSFVFRRNIVFWQDGKLLAGRWKDDHYVMDSNLYWKVDEQDLDFSGSTLEEWRKKGQGKHSMIHDPKFKNAAVSNYTFTDREAISEIGFVPFSRKHVGPRLRHH